MLIEKFDQVSLGVATLEHGTSKNGVGWARWKNTHWTHFSLKPRVNGRRQMTVYRSQAVKGGRVRSMRNITSYEWKLSVAGTNPALIPAIAAMHERVGVVKDPRIAELEPVQAVQAYAYPFLEATADWEAMKLTRKPVRGLAPALRTTTAHDFAEAAFGKRLIRKDLVRAVGKADLRRVVLARQVKNLVPVDWLAQFLEMPMPKHQYFDDEVQVENLATVLELIPEHARRRFLLSLVDDADFRLLADAEQSVLDVIAARPDGREWLREHVKDTRTWRALHDAAASAQRRVDNDDVPIPQDARYKAIDGITALDGRFVIRSAKRTEELDDWGDAMDNCIGSYRAWALNHTSYLFALLDNGKLLANIEIGTGGTIRQIYGRFNEPIPADEDAAVRRAIANAQAGGAREVVSAPNEHLLAA